MGKIFGHPTDQLFLELREILLLFEIQSNDEQNKGGNRDLKVKVETPHGLMGNYEGNDFDFGAT